jgi:hypothetical protein
MAHCACASMTPLCHIQSTNSIMQVKGKVYHKRMVKRTPSWMTIAFAAVVVAAVTWTSANNNIGAVAFQISSSSRTHPTKVLLQRYPSAASNNPFFLHGNSHYQQCYYYQQAHHRRAACTILHGLFDGNNNNNNNDSKADDKKPTIPPELLQQITQAEANTPAAQSRQQRIILYFTLTLLGVTTAFFNAFLSSLRYGDGSPSSDLSYYGFEWLQSNCITVFLFTNKIGGGLGLLGAGLAGTLAEVEVRNIDIVYDQVQ